MRPQSLPYHATGRFARVVLDYLDKAPPLRPLYAWPFSRQGIQEAIAARRFAPEARMRLLGALRRQYAGMDLHPAVAANLKALEDPASVTVTTGHQLCLFTGPLYVPLKILNVVRLARNLSTAGRPVVPVFWMATEDHDRAEVDHAWLGDRRLTWPGATAGAVGRMPLSGIEAVLEELDEALGHGSRAEELLALVRRCYRPEHTLAQATRLFVDALFGHYGVIVLDGDDAELKAAFAPIVRTELVEQATAAAEALSRDALEPYGEQAFARPINLFYLEAEGRTRIEHLEGGYRLSGTGPLRTQAEVLREVDEHPERFSPNVLLRPLYQETILPNVAYVGGGGEVAYWLQLKPVFDRFHVQMPVVVLRTSAAFLLGKDPARLRELQLDVPDLFRPLDELRTRVALSRATFSTSLAGERDRAFGLYEELAQRARQANPTLEGAARAAAQRSLKALERLEAKFVRVAKRQQADDLARLDAIHAHVFPSNGLQERRDNFMPFYLRFGDAFFDTLLNALDPLDQRFTVLVEE